MDTNEHGPILTELQALRRLIRKSSLVIALILIAQIALITLFRLPFHAPDPYTEAYKAMRSGDYSRAIELATKIVSERPRDYTAQEYLGSAYLGSGDLRKAEEAYSRAYAIYPSDEIKRILLVVQKRRAAAETTPSPAPP